MMRRQDADIEAMTSLPPPSRRRRYYADAAAPTSERRAIYCRRHYAELTIIRRCRRRYVDDATPTFHFATPPMPPPSHAAITPSRYFRRQT